MSERAAAAGDKGPPFTLEHKGKTYEFRPVITDDVMLQVESKLYKRACDGLMAQKEMMDKDAYSKKLDDLRKRFESGEFSFESKHTMEFLQHQDGAIMLLQCITNATKAELMELILEKPEEMQHHLEAVLALSMPKGKLRAPRQKRKGPKHLKRSRQGR